MTKFKTKGIADNGHGNVNNVAINKRKRRKSKKKKKVPTAIINSPQAQGNSKPRNQKNGANFQWKKKWQKHSNNQLTGSKISTSTLKFPLDESATKEDSLYAFDTSLSDDVNKVITIKKEVRILENYLDEKLHEDSNTNMFENEQIMLFDILKQQIKEEMFSDAAEDAVKDEGMNMLQSLKLEIKKELSTDDDENEAGNYEVMMFENLKREIKEEPSNDDKDDTDDKASLPDNSVVKSEEDYELRAANDNVYLSMLLTNRGKIEVNNRTVFISNVPPTSDVSKLWKKFRQLGVIETIRFRGPVNPNQTGIRIVPLHPKPSRKVSAILKQDPWKTDCYFITYKEDDSATKALLMNGKKWNGNILRVNTVLRKEHPNIVNAVSLENLPPTIEENELWELFEQCGRVKFVRIIRDRITGLARGIGYIIFESANEAALAADLNGTVIRKRPLQIFPYTPKPKKKRNLKKQLKKSFYKKLRKKQSTMEVMDSQTGKSAASERLSKWIQKSKKDIAECWRREKQRVKSGSNWKKKLKQ